ncbi:MAG: PQQ-binding-like beta-propeller repeat protein [Planctomycetales bacterium]|nr:PQQ-binding-like beta-propeller repeat protein [Planctomycetales bacterium]
MKARLAATIVLSIAVHSIAGDFQSNWRSWRGPSDSGSIDQGTYPTTFDADNVLWKTELPGKGCSTPIVNDRVIYVTAPVDGNDALLAYSWSGDELWRRSFGTENAGKHRNGSGCNASPVTDGNALFVYFKSGTFAAVELDGSVRWKTDLVQRYGKDTLFWDHGTSPVLTDKYVVMARMHQGESWLAAFDKQSGELAWKVARNFATPTEGDHGYSTPLVIQHNGKESILVWGAQHITIHDAHNGEVLWKCGNFNPDNNRLWPSIAMPVIIDDMAVISFGRNDRGIPRLFGVRLSGTGDVTSTNHVWLRDDISSFVPSPASYNGHVYLVRDKGEVECVDPANGQSIWSEAFPKHRSAYYASPLIAGGHIYAPREDGVVMVASVANDKFEFISANDMKEPVIGSPVPVENRLLLRGARHLFCVGEE